MNEQTRKFADACHENSIDELKAARNSQPDQSDMAEWGITADEWRLAIETAISELEAE